MKTRWAIDQKALVWLAGLWFVCNLTRFCILALVHRHWGPHHQDNGANWGHLWMPGALWLGPYVIVTLGVLLVYLPTLLRYVLHNPIIYRVTEPVTTDLRKVEK